MTYELEEDALRVRFNTQWAGATVIAWPNVDFDPPANASWVRWQIDTGDSVLASFGDPGNNVHRHTGLVTVSVFTLRNLGSSAALTLADNAAAIYRNWRDAASGIRFLVPPSIRRIGNDGSWYQINVLAPYERDSLF